MGEQLGAKTVLMSLTDGEEAVLHIGDAVQSGRIGESLDVSQR